MADVMSQVSSYGVVGFALVAAGVAVVVDRLLARRSRVPDVAAAAAVVSGRSPAGMVASGIAMGVEVIAEMSRCPEVAMAMASRPGSSEAMESAVVGLARSGDACVALAFCPAAGEGDVLVAAFGRRRIAWVDGSFGPALVSANGDVSARVAERGSIVLRIDGVCRIAPLPVWGGAGVLSAVSRLGELGDSEARTALRLNLVQRSFSGAVAESPGRGG